MTFKKQVHTKCAELVEEKIALLKQILTDLKESASNETKSTAGDKHETALAMLQIEQKNISIQLKQLLLQKNAINKIIPAVKPLYVTSGALVKTNKGYLFISIPLGKIIVERVNVIALSAQSPLGSKLMGLKLNETITVNNIAYTIEHIE